MNWYKKAQYNQYGVPLDFEERTGIPFYDDTLSNREMTWTDPKTWNQKSGLLKDYLKEIKGRESHIEYMSPDEYIDICAVGFNKTKEEIIKRRRSPAFENGMTLIDKYKQRWIDGENPPMGFIEYVNGQFSGQEGLHRAIMAKEMGVELIPVLIMNRRK